MKIALVNVTPDSNKGSCALTWASLDLLLNAFPEASVAIVPIAMPDPAPFRLTELRYPNVTILPALFDGEGKRAPVLVWRLAQKLVEVLRFHRERPDKNPTLEWIRSCDLVVSVGGVTFQTEGTLRDDPRLLTRVLPLLAARKIDVPVALVGAQLGPFETRFGRWLCGKIVAKAAAVFPRDRTSASTFRGLEKHRRSILLPDSVLTLTTSEAPIGELLRRRGLDAGAPTLALVISSALRASERRETHVTLFADLARRLADAGVARQILVVLQADEDRAISVDLVRELGLDPRFFIDDDLDPGQLTNLYRACRMVVSSRLHAVLLSFLAGVPAVSLAPEVTFKERAVLDLLGLEALWIPSAIGPDAAAEKCLAIASEDERYRRLVLSAISAARAQWDSVPQELHGIVQESHRVSERQIRVRTGFSSRSTS